MLHTVYIELGDRGSFLEEVPVEVDFECSPRVPARVSGPVEACHPAEGGEVEVHLARALLGPSPAPTLNAVCLVHVVEERCYDELGEYADEHSGPDPDELYDRYRDDQLTGDL